MENFRLGNTTITFSDDFEILNEFRQAVKAETDGISPGTDISKGIKEGRKPNVDRLAHGYTDYLNSIFTEELVPLAVNFLVHYDIYDCSEELFIRKYQEKYFLMDNRPEFKKFLQEYTAISDEYSQKKAYQKVYRANRSKWIGGGFGIKGAIKGSIDATILNTATGLFRGIGDGIDDFYSSVEFKNQKEDLLTENLFDNIDSAFHSCCLGVVLKQNMNPTKTSNAHGIIIPITNDLTHSFKMQRPELLTQKKDWLSFPKQSSLIHITNNFMSISIKTPLIIKMTY